MNRKKIALLIVIVMVAGLVFIGCGNTPEIQEPDYDNGYDADIVETNEVNNGDDADISADESESEVAEAAADDSNSLVGTWLWMGSPYYILEADGYGTMAGSPIRWSSNRGILSICVTPDVCGNNCLASADWEYQIIGNELTLDSTIMDMSFTYTRR